jgi:hypothetical protein
VTTRTTIYYGGQEYVVPRSADELKAEVEGIIAAGTGWLTVNHGRGELRVAHIFVSHATSIGLIDTSDPETVTPGDID